MIRKTILFSLLSASLLSASTVVYTVTSTPDTLATGSGTGSAIVTVPLVQVSQFDPGLGTLTSLTVRANYKVELSGIVNSGPDSGDLDLYLSNEIRIGIYGMDQCEDGNADGNDGGASMKSFIYCNKTTGFSPLDLTDRIRTAVTGTGTIEAGWPGTGTVHYNNVETYSVKLISGSTTVTYSYDPIPTPEPASVALSASAFALFAVVARRRAGSKPFLQ